MSAAENFLTPLQEQAVVKAIQMAEQKTSGEIRVHIEAQTTKPPLERAKEVFCLLNMHVTLARNGVLFYVNVANNAFVILGDQGINQVVPNNFWDAICDQVLESFKQKKHQEGLVNGILQAGAQLQKHFPFTTNDTNELPNEISKA